MRPVRFYPEAEAEMIDAASWYASRQTDLGKRFLASIQDSLNKIQINPTLYPVVEGDVRRCLTKTFPFGILFRVQTDRIVVVAVMHLHRDPDCWKQRRSEAERYPLHGKPLIYERPFDGVDEIE
ncbi:type II toxin-antitoxin system RelE/ParE family toxin [Candidatus Sumerlaeota bacterium]|nr:type II toxin-antitoxin system RelE/ParE family toxin [Candidatus Sumerlaeota bacterium]